MTRLISDTYPRARKPHHCALCCRTIREGETYRRRRWTRRDGTLYLVPCGGAA